jgi:hypothetical protein
MAEKQYGFLYGAISTFIDCLKYLNLVEFFKFIARKIIKTRNKKDPIAFSNRVGADIFIICKWALLFVLWHWHFSSSIVAGIVWYLIITNVFTYFYYHIWTKEAISADAMPIDQVRRRFLNLVLAAAFSTLSFAFLFSVPYQTNFDWKGGSIDKIHSILFSFSNSLAANYEDVKPITDFGNIIANVQLLISFVFFTVILSRSLPQTTSKT